METGKPGLVSAPVHISSIAAQTEKRMDIQAPLTAVYIHTVPALPAQPFPQPPAAARESPALHLAMPSLYSKETLPFLTLHIAGGLQSQPGLSLAAAAPAARPKSAGKHVCPHCGRDCMKPSVLEKHLRCHTGERPYPCTVCGVSFKTQSNLYKHKRTQAHARLSSESEQSSLGSLDSISNSRETYTSSLSVEERGEEPGCLEKDASLPAAEISSPTSTTKVCSGKTPGSTSEQNELTPTGPNPGPHEKPTRDDEKQKKENENPPLPAGRHLPLQRQEATLFSKQWESSVSRGKSQSHESTDSGFSEISDHYPSPSSVLPDHSMDSLTESTKEHLLETTDTHSEPGQGNQDSKDNAREQEQKILEERISKLISQNSAVVEDKQLENVRPRKTVLSKQGSIDLPMPYTYKDSFHFDMRINKTQTVGLQRNKMPAFYNSVPTQHSMTMEHAPLIRSNSLPFSVTLLQPERSSPTTPYPSDYVTLVRRGSSGQINPTGFAIKPMNQQSSTHRPLVRQTAVDCNHATDGLFKNSSVEEACTSSLSCDGGDGDICGEPSNRKFRRKKAQKFAYNKWYMYGGGTFKKLYDDRGGDSSVVKGRKSLTTPEHEVIQGLQKRLSAGHKETGTITGSMQNFTSNTATVCHPVCPPTRPPPVPGVEFNLKSAQFHSSCTSLRMPLRRNLSLSTLPLPSIGSLVTHTTDSISRTEAGRVINEGKHTDSTSHFGGAHIPSDRKKQRTDDKIVCPQEMETDPNTVTHPPPSVTASVPQQDTKLTYINIKTNQNHAQLKAALFPACIINANAPSASTSPASSIPTAAKTSFLPKYQLKLPNASESDSNPSLQVGNKLTGSDGSSFTSVLPSTVKTLPSATVSEKQCSDPINTPLTQPCTSNFSSTQLVLSCAATTPSCQADTPGLSQKVTSTPAVAHKLFAATTKTTACLHDYQAGLCSTMAESSPMKTTVQLLKPVASETKNTPATSTITTDHNQSRPAASTGFSQAQQNLPPHINASTSSGQSNQLNGVTTSSNSPLMPCHIVPFDSGQPVAQNVFHVHTADLQICLQIISDEQLALIEPQIERQAGSSLSQTCEMEVMAGGTQNKAQSFDTTQSTNEERDCEQLGLQREINQSKSLPTLNMDNIKPPMSVSFENAQPNIPMTQATAECESPEDLALSIRPHKYSHINMDAEPRNYAGEVMSTGPSLKGVKAGRSQTSEKEHALPVNCSAEEQRSPDRRVSQGELIPQTLSGQHKLCPENMTRISFSSENECNSELPVEERQPKPRNQGSLCSGSKMKTVAHQSSRSENDDASVFVQVGPGQAFSAACTNEHSGSASSFSISNGRTPRQLKTQASIYSISPVECTLSETLNSCKYVNTGYEHVLDTSAPSQEISLSKSEDVISLAPSEQQPAQVTSVSCNIQVEGPKDIPAELKTIPNPNTGFIDGDSPAERAAQKEQQTQADGGASGRPDSTEQGPQQSQEVRETNQQCMEGQGSSREEKNGGMESDNCRPIILPDMINPEGEVRKVKPDSFQNSLLSEQHLQHLSQTHSGMSEYPPQSPQQVPGLSNNLPVPAHSAQVGPGNTPQPSLEAGHLCLSQHWESGAHSPQDQCEADSCQSTDKLPQPRQTQAGSYSEPDFHQTFSHVEQQEECKKSSMAPSAERGGDNGAVTGCSVESGVHRGLLSDVKPTSSAAQISQISLCGQIHTVMDDLRGETANLTNATLLGNGSTRPSKTFMYSEPDTDDRQEYSTQSSNSGRADITNKYQSFFFASQLQSYQAADCLSGVVRPVQSCQDYPEDTSSSDDEGKLIIEL